MRDDRLPFRGGEQGVAQADDPARRDVELDVQAVALHLHAEQFAFATAHQIDHFAAEGLRHLYGEHFDRLATLAVDLLVDHLRLAQLELVALAAHGLHQDTNVQNATTVDQQLVRAVRFLHAHRQVLLDLLEEAVAQVTAGDVFTLPAEERRGVDGEEHAHRGLVHLEAGQTFRVLEVSNGVANVESVQTHDRAEFAAVQFAVLHLLLTQAFEHHQLGHLAFHDAAIVLHEAHVLAGLDGPATYTPHGDTALEAAVVEAGDPHLQAALFLLRRRYVLQDHVQEIAHILRRGLPIRPHPTLFAAAVHHGEIQLVLVGLQGEHEVEHLLVHLFRCAVRLIHLVDHDDGLQTELDGLAQYEACLRHGAFESIHQQQHPIGHVQHALHLATEVAVARSVDHIDLHALVTHAYVLREDGDATLTL